MVMLLILIIAGVTVTQCRHVSPQQDELSNEISLGTSGAASPPSSVFGDEVEWVKISNPSPPVISKVAGSYVELECEAMGSPAPTIQWLKGNTPLTENSFENNMISEIQSQGMAKVRARVVINFLLPVHSGRFTCRAASGFQVAMASTTIHVITKEGFDKNFTQLLSSQILGAHHKPRVSLWAPTYMDVIGTNVILPCRSYGNPKPNLFWVDPDGRVLGENDARVSALPDGSLSIRSLSWADMGIYKCVVQNIKGEDIAETFLYPMKQESK